MVYDNEIKKIHLISFEHIFLSDLSAIHHIPRRPWKKEELLILNREKFSKNDKTLKVFSVNRNVKCMNHHFVPEKL